MQNQEKIAQAIAAYLEKNTEHIWHSQGERMAFSKPCEYPVFSEQSFLQAIAAEIAAAIAPHMEAGAGWKPQIDEMVLVDGKIEGSFRGMRAGLACIAFKGGMQMNIALDRVTPGQCTSTS